MDNVLVKAVVIERRTVKGTAFVKVLIKGKENPIWVEEADIVEDK